MSQSDEHKVTSVPDRVLLAGSLISSFKDVAATLNLKHFRSKTHKNKIVIIIIIVIILL